MPHRASDTSHRIAAESQARRQAMATLASADPEVLESLWGDAGLPEQANAVRAPETGLVTLRGRIGGGGAPFNLGEATVTRASVSVGGFVGHAYALGRSRRKATLSAICDALWQDPAMRPRIEREILAPLRAARDEADSRRREETEATRVDFFTLVRGEDA